MVYFILFCFYKFISFIYFWLRWVAACRFSLVAVSWGYTSLLCTGFLSSCGERGLLFVVVCGLLTAVASLVAEHEF